MSEDSEDLAFLNHVISRDQNIFHNHSPLPRAAIKIYITHFTRIFNDHFDLVLYKNKGVMGCGNPNNFNCFWK